MHPHYFHGYDKSLSGFNFQYHSPIPSITDSIILRAEKDYEPIEWQTDVIPLELNESYINFFWIYSTSVGYPHHSFGLLVDGKKILSFNCPSTNEKNFRTFNGVENSELTFSVVEIDKYHDEFGFAFLKLPITMVEKGKSVSIKIENESYDSSAWIMTYKGKIEEKISVHQLSVVTKDNGLFYNTVRFEIIYIGETVEAVIDFNTFEKKNNLKLGNNVIDIIIPAVKNEYSLLAKININGIPEKQIYVELKPVREWEVYMIQHTHTDIGYTRPQTEILPEHLRYIDYALDLCDSTDHYPDNAKFRWTCESAWSVREYLRSRPKSQIDNLIKRINEGRIEVTGMFFNFSEIIDEAGLAIQAKTIKEFYENKIAVNTIMQNDVNGIGWCLIDYYANTSVKYLIMGEHGHRARIPFKIPTNFWWKSPSGNKLLAYRSEHYMHGNVLGILSNDIELFKNNLSKYLSELEIKGYPSNEIAFQFSGYVIDNAPPSISACDLVKEWNKKYEWPKLKLAVANEFMELVNDKYAENLPIIQAAWPDWWTDGFGSSLRETQAIRKVQANMIANMGLLTIAKMLSSKFPSRIFAEIESIYDSILFFNEHTFGASESITDPQNENSMIQWSEKSAYCWDAVKKASMLKEKILGLIQPYIGKPDIPSIVIFNTLAWNRLGLATVYIDHNVLPRNRQFSIIDDSGSQIKVQELEVRPEGTYWGLAVNGVPAMGYSIYRIKLTSDSRFLAYNNNRRTLENEYYKISISKKGLIGSVFDKELEMELVDNNAKYKFGELIYEELDNRYQLERFTSSKMDLEYKPLDGKRKVMDKINSISYKDGNIWESISLKGNLDGCTDERGLDIEIRLFKYEKKIELKYSLFKINNASPESLYIAFPFFMAGGKVSFDAQGGIVVPGENQLEGTSSDWNTIQNYAAVKNKNSQFIFLSNDIPLVQFGNINTGRFYYNNVPANTHIYSWVLNNYWTTNFKASQEGQFKWSYFITSTNDCTNSFATRFALNNNIPMVSRVMPAGNEANEKRKNSLIKINAENILIINSFLSKDLENIILLFKECDGVETNLSMKKLFLNKKYENIVEVNLLDESIGIIDDYILFKPFEIKFIKLSF